MKYAQRLGKAAAHKVRSPRTPGPKLRADVIDISNAFAAQLPRETEMKTGKIREDRKGGFAAIRLFDNVAHGANKRWQTLQDFSDAHDRNFRIIGDDLNAGGAHLRTAHAEYGDVDALLQSSGQPRCIHVPGSFAGGEKKRNRRHVRREMRSVARPNRGRLGCAASFQGKMQLLLFVLELIQTEVNAALSEKFLVCALFTQPAFVEYEDAVCVLDGAQAVRDDKRSTAGEQAAQGFANLQLGFRIHARRGFVKNQETRVVG